MFHKATLIAIRCILRIVICQFLQFWQAFRLFVYYWDYDRQIYIATAYIGL